MENMFLVKIHKHVNQRKQAQNKFLPDFTHTIKI